MWSWIPAFAGMTNWILDIAMFSLPILISILSTTLFGLLAIIFSIREERTKKLLRAKEIQYKQHLYETTILREIQDRIGYSLDIEKVTDVIIGSLDNLFSYSTVSSMIIKNKKIIFKTHIQESVSKNFLGQLKQSMLGSLAALLTQPIPTVLDENITGTALDDSSLAKFESFFHIPLIVNDQVVGLISIASTTPNLYLEQEMTILYKITSLAVSSLSRLQDVLTIEKGKLISMITSLEDGVFMVDSSSQITVINKAAKDFMRITKEQPTIIDVLSSLPNTDNFGEKIQLAISQNKKIEEKEFKLNDRNINIFITPVLDATTSNVPTVIGAAVLLHDITLEKSLSKMKEDFTNIIVHELRSPLTAIKASTEMLISEKNLKPEDREKLIQMANLSSKRMLEEVALILDAAKLDAGLFTVIKFKGDLKRIIQERIDTFQSEAQIKKIVLRTDLDPTLPEFDFDPIHIGQVLNNLLSNSLKFTQSGGIITISAHQIPNKVVLSVSDTGMGIPKEKQSQLFSKFVQVQKPNSAIGTGLGLYIVKGIAKAHDGDVTLDSEPGHGTTVTLTLPITQTSTVTTSTQPTQYQPLHLTN